MAIILDGNGRWAETRGWPRTLGHRAGIEAVRRTVEAAPELGVGVLTLFAFSSDNWGRPAPEVAALMRLLRSFLRREVPRCADRGVRVSFLGRRDRLPGGLPSLLDEAEQATASGRGLHLRLAVDYSARDAIVRAALRWRADGNACATAPDETVRREFARLMQREGNGEANGLDFVPDVDLLIRTGGERRLSDFLLWECAYAELLFTRRMWPDFDARSLRAALNEFRRRDRRFGRLPRRAAAG